MSDDYEVGYGKPPKHSQFQPGVSGNPKGRPKGQANFLDILNTIAAEKIPVRQNGKLKRVPTIEAVMRRAYASACNGDFRGLKFLMVFSDKGGASFLSKAAADASETARKEEAGKRLMELAAIGNKRRQQERDREIAEDNARLAEIERATAALNAEREALERAKREKDGT